MTNYNKKYNLGFTLIELLVVVAIIGILSSIVLVSLGGARTRGTIAAIKAEMANLRAQAELVYAQYGSYEKFCDSTDVQSDKLITSIKSRSGSTKVPVCSVSKSQWGYAIVLPDKTSWCVDSTGFAGNKTGVTDGVCSGAQFSPVI